MGMTQTSTQDIAMKAIEEKLQGSALFHPKKDELKPVFQSLITEVQDLIEICDSSIYHFSEKNREKEMNTRKRFFSIARNFPFKKNKNKEKLKKLSSTQYKTLMSGRTHRYTATVPDKYSILFTIKQRLNSSNEYESICLNPQITPLTDDFKISYERTDSTVDVSFTNKDNYSCRFVADDNHSTLYFKTPENDSLIQEFSATDKSVPTKVHLDTHNDYHFDYTPNSNNVLYGILPDGKTTLILQKAPDSDLFQCVLYQNNTITSIVHFDKNRNVVPASQIKEISGLLPYNKGTFKAYRNDDGSMKCISYELENNETREDFYTNNARTKIWGKEPAKGQRYEADCWANGVIKEMRYYGSNNYFKSLSYDENGTLLSTHETKIDAIIDTVYWSNGTPKEVTTKYHTYNPKHKRWDKGKVVLEEFNAQGVRQSFIIETTKNVIIEGSCFPNGAVKEQTTTYPDNSILIEKFAKNGKRSSSVKKPAPKAQRLAIQTKGREER